MAESATAGPLEQQESPPKRFSGSFLALCREESARTKSHQGPPSKIATETIEAIATAVANGVPFATACVAAGIAGRTASRWIEKGKEQEAAGRNTIYVQFVELLKKAQAIGHRTLANEVASNPDWRAKAFILERRYPDTWGKKEQATHVTNVAISDALASQLLASMRVAGAVLNQLPPAIETTALSIEQSDSDAPK